MRNQSRRSASQKVTAKLISAFVFATRIVQLLSFLNLACFCDCTDWFVLDLVGNPEDQFSRVAAHISVGKKPTL